MPTMVCQASCEHAVKSKGEGTTRVALGTAGAGWTGPTGLCLLPHYVHPVSAPKSRSSSKLTQTLGGSSRCPLEHHPCRTVLVVVRCGSSVAVAVAVALAPSPPGAQRGVIECSFLVWQSTHPWKSHPCETPAPPCRHVRRPSTSVRLSPVFCPFFAWPTPLPHSLYLASSNCWRCPLMGGSY